YVLPNLSNFAVDRSLARANSTAQDGGVGDYVCNCVHRDLAVCCCADLPQEELQVSPASRILPASILIVRLGLLYPMQQWIDKISPRESVSEEALYLSSGETIKKMSLGMESLAADIYWIRTVQYFGRKLIDSGKPLSSAATKDIRMDLLAPLLNIVV